MTAPRLSSIFAMLAASALASCGGSASESPWPVEPEGAAPGPVGETTDRDEMEMATDVADERETPGPGESSDPDAGPSPKRR